MQYNGNAPGGGNHTGTLQRQENRYQNSTRKNGKTQVPIPIYSESGKVVGKVIEDVFYKTIQGSKHMLRKPPAIAIDVDSLEQAEQAGATRVQVQDRESGVVYRAPISQIWRDGIRFNRGFGEQIALPLAGWSLSKKGGGLQLPMFG